MRRFWLVFLSLQVLLVISNHQVVDALKYRSEIIAKMSRGGSVKKASADSSVLRELKETIQKQAIEIDTLKKSLKKGSSSSEPPAANAGGAHGGAAPSDDEIAIYLNRPFHGVAFSRVGVLGIFFVSLSLTAVIMNGFEKTLERQIELAYFVPLLAGHGGNTGGQTVCTVLSAISAGAIGVQDAPRVVYKEAMSGLVSGSILGALVGPFAHYVMGISVHVSTVVFLTIPWCSVIAGALGSAIPFICISLGIEPSVVAAPAMTSAVDVIGLMSYFLIANKIFVSFGVDL